MKTKSSKKNFDALRVGAEIRMTHTTWRIESIDKLTARLVCVASRVPVNPVNVSVEQLRKDVSRGIYTVDEGRVKR